MSAERLLNVLSNDLTINTLVNNRVVMAPADQGTKTPFIAYEFQNDDPIKDLQGVVTSITRQDFEIIIVSEKYSKIDEIKKQVIRVMNNEYSQFRANYLSSDYEFDPDTNTHKHILTYQITYQTA